MKRTVSCRIQTLLEFFELTQRAEMSPNSANLLLKDLVVESCLEFSLAGRGCGDIHRCLATTKNDKILLRSN